MVRVAVLAHRHRVWAMLLWWFLVSASAVVGRAAAKPQVYSMDDCLDRGIQALQQGGLLEQAVDWFQNGIQVAKDNEDGDYALSTIMSLHTNLATALSEQGNDQQAALSYQDALSVYQKEIHEIVDKAVKKEADELAAQTSFFLGMVYQDISPEPKDAVEAYTLAGSLDPQLWAAFANLGSVLQDNLSDYRQALVAYNQAFAILTDTTQEPTDAPTDPRYILSQLQYRMGLCISSSPDKCVVQDRPDQEQDCKELATHAFSLAVQYDPTNELAKHMLAAITADSTMTRASNDYVQSLFDDYASSFEHSLVQELRYTGFERLRRGFDRAFGGNSEHVPTFDLVVDAGCGTGLVGEQFRNISTTLIGVDLSQAILDEAVQNRPGLYDQVVAADVTQVFRDKKQTISLIIAADSYIYFGDLDPLFESMQEGLADDGYLAFTLENVGSEDEEILTETKPDWRWQLTASGRFAHRKEYVLEVAMRHDFELKHYEPLDGFRFEKGTAVRGHMFVMKNAASNRKDEL